MTGFSDAMRRVYDAVKDIPWSALSALEKGSTISAGEFQLTLFKPGREGIRNASVIFTTIIPCDREVNYPPKFGPVNKVQIMVGKTDDDEDPEGVREGI
ncbi:MAG: hypothetical protein ACK5UY_00195 [Holosporales bacterium]